MAKTLQLLPSDSSSEMNVIRTETALSRFPFHNLSKGEISIDITTADHSFAWSVSPSKRYGLPGPLAYKLDTLVINRRIEKAGKPVPKLIRLGSLHEVAQELSLTRNTNEVKKALFQNVGTLITCKVTYKARDKTEHTVEAAFHRYDVILTGKTLPDGTKADAVYIDLSSTYMEILNNALTRPLDYDYLYTLSPMSQRFYEVVSYAIYPAVKFKQRAKLAYSEFCLLSTARRYTDFEHVKKQMYKIHQPHIQSGYIEKEIQYEAAVDEHGQPDWVICYRPGKKALAEYRQLTLHLGPNDRSKKQLELPEPKHSQTTQAGSETPPNDASRPLTWEEPAETLVRHFYEVFQKSGKTARPSAKELTQARDLLERLGEGKARFLIAYVHREAPKTDWKPKSFGGILHYEGAAMTAYASQTQERFQKASQIAQNDHQSRFQGEYTKLP